MVYTPVSATKDPGTSFQQVQIVNKRESYTPGASKQQRFETDVVLRQDCVPVVEHPELIAREESSNEPSDVEKGQAEVYPEKAIRSATPSILNPDGLGG